MSFPAMIFAAGFGTRMGELTERLPKPLIEVAGKPLLNYAIDVLLEADINSIVVNAHYHSEQIKRHLASSNIKVSLEYPHILDTGGGLKAALPKLAANTVITQNADIIWVGPNPVKTLIAAWYPERMDSLMMCIPMEKARTRKEAGDYSIAKDGHVIQGRDYIFSGLQIMKTDCLYEIKKNSFSLKVMWDKMVMAKRLFALKYQGIWCDVGYPEGIEIAEATLIDNHNV
ncbi:MAG: nucleotidyltransferase family protein [Aestuariivita sp.]|nr:nucleotidyltransferase family protein [Aestuariivita sp.]